MTNIKRDIGINLDEIFEALKEYSPEWDSLIKVLDFHDALQEEPITYDNRNIYYNSELLRHYPKSSQLFYFAQQLLHIQLSHYDRGLYKDPILWKIASDAVVNNMLVEDGFILPGDAISLKEAKDTSAEELYELLETSGTKLLNKHKLNEYIELDDQPIKLSSRRSDNSEGRKDRKIEEQDISKAVANIIELLEPSLQLDYDWYPGDVIKDGMLKDSFKPFPVPHAEILLDTSASIDERLLRTFVREVKALLREDAIIKVGCFDTEFYGFQEIQSTHDIDNFELKGSGGTNFDVAVNAFTGDAETKIIFTDGYAEMPNQRCDAIWLVYSSSPIHPKGGKVIYVKQPKESENHEIEFLIT